jgi:hypothetical protein
VVGTSCERGGHADQTTNARCATAVGGRSGWCRSVILAMSRYHLAGVLTSTTWSATGLSLCLARESKARFAEGVAAAAKIRVWQAVQVGVIYDMTKCNLDSRDCP